MQRLFTACISVISLMILIAATQSDEFPILNAEPLTAIATRQRVFRNDVKFTERIQMRTDLFSADYSLL